MNIVFLSLVIILAVASITLKKTVSALIAFGMMMLVLGFYYIYLDEKLLGLFQIFVYAGGIGVLMLFGITLVGVEFPSTKERYWTAFLAGLFFVVSLVIFFGSYTSGGVSAATVEPKGLFASHYGDYAIIFGLIASSLLYGTVKMLRVLKPKRGQDV